MNTWPVTLVSAFGRGETLALALYENGFQVKILDFTAAFAPEYQRGAGPFPVVDKAFFPVQREFLNEVELQPQGLTIWLKDGPFELTGPFSGVHIHSHPEVQAWKTNSHSGEFSKVWLQRFLSQWTSPFFMESWNEIMDPPYPAELSLGNIPAARESRIHSFERVRSKNVEVIACTGIRDAQIQSGRIAQIEVEAGSSKAVSAQQWIWCLSSSESETFGKEAARKIFGRGIAQPEWAWQSFAGKMQKGPWTSGLPNSFVVIGDVYLPWCYANVSVVQRTDETHFRVWIKVPRARMGDIDARRAWVGELQKLFIQRLPMAEWKLDSADWSICPHSEIFAESQRGQTLNGWKNWHLISPEVLPRLDISARLELEAESFRKLLQWRTDQLKKQGVRRDQALHAT